MTCSEHGSLDSSCLRPLTDHRRDRRVPECGRLGCRIRSLGIVVDVTSRCVSGHSRCSGFPARSPIVELCEPSCDDGWLVVSSTNGALQHPGAPEFAVAEASVSSTPSHQAPSSFCPVEELSRTCLHAVILIRRSNDIGEGWPPKCRLSFPLANG